MKKVVHKNSAFETASPTTPSTPVGVLAKEYSMKKVIKEEKKKSELDHQTSDVTTIEGGAIPRTTDHQRRNYNEDKEKEE